MTGNNPLSLEGKSFQRLWSRFCTTMTLETVVRVDYRRGHRCDHLYGQRKRDIIDLLLLQQQPQLPTISRYSYSKQSAEITSKGFQNPLQQNC
jgi:hypothetical protein